MNKLEERFEDIIHDQSGNTCFYSYESYENCAKYAAKEAKDIAINFAMYAREEWRRFHEEQKHSVEISWIISWEKFINQRYEK